MAAGININLAVAANVGSAVRGLNQATDSVKKLDRAIKPANDNLARMEKLLQGKGGGNRFFRTGLQQVGYQVGDFAVQVGNGTSAIQAFGQQAPQLLQIFGPIGSIVGAAVSVFAAVAVVFEKTGKEAKKNTPKVKDLSDAISQLNAAGNRVASTFDTSVASSLEEAEKRYGKVTAALRTFLDAQREVERQASKTAGINALSKFREALPADIRRNLEELNRIDVVLSPAAGESAVDFANAVRQQKKAIEDLKQKIPEAAREVDNLFRQFKIAAAAGQNFDSILVDLVAAVKELPPEQQLAILGTKGLVDAAIRARAQMDEYAGRVDKATSSTGRLTKATKDLLAQLEPLDTTKGTLEPLIRQLDIQEKINQLLRQGASHEEAKRIAATGVGNEVERARAAVEAHLAAQKAITEELTKREDMGGVRTGRVPVPQARPEIRPFLAEITKVQQQIDIARLSMDLINTGGFSPELAKQAAELKVQVGLTNEQMSVLVPKLQELEQLKTPVQSLQEAFRELADTVLDKVSSAFTTAFTGIVNGTKSVSQAFKEMVGSILADFAKMMAQKAAASLFGSLFSGLGGLFGGGYGASAALGRTGLGTMASGGFVPFIGPGMAKGGAFSHGNVVPFARGGVIGKPTLFPMAKGAGLMGEAGPEAIMPLTRGPDGKLGVAGGGANVNVNIINQAGADVEAKQNGPDIDVIIRRAVTSDIANGGQIYRAIGQRFETSTRLTRR